ncbi:hypothetical protein MCOR02_004740 [Pyricularia oryzae]|nr:hypothetical protein MCOR02_004740 [Pyricularia oryzae]
MPKLNLQLASKTQNTTNALFLSGEHLLYPNSKVLPKESHSFFLLTRNGYIESYGIDLDKLQPTTTSLRLWVLGQVVSRKQQHTTWSSTRLSHAH